MKITEIRQKKKELSEQIRQSQAQQEVLCIQLRQLQKECTHPKAYRTSHMGEPCRACPDCGGCGI